MSISNKIFVSKVAKKDSIESGVEPYKEHFGLRLLVQCEEFSLKLHSQLGSDEGVNQVRPSAL